MHLTGHRLAYLAGYLISLIGSCAILGVLLFIVIPDCAGVAAKSGGSASCAMNMPAVYVIFLIFAAIIVFSGVRAGEILLEAKDR